MEYEYLKADDDVALAVRRRAAKDAVMRALTEDLEASRLEAIESSPEEFPEKTRRRANGAFAGKKKDAELHRRRADKLVAAVALDGEEVSRIEREALEAVLRELELRHANTTGTLLALRDEADAYDGDEAVRHAEKIANLEADLGFIEHSIGFVRSSREARDG